METGGEYFVPQLTGHSTRDALRILHDELQNVILVHEANQRQKSVTKKCRQSFLNHTNKHSPLHWTNCLVLLVLAVSLIIAYGAQAYRDHWLIAEAIILLIGLGLNIYIINLDERLREYEIIDKARCILKAIKACSEGAEWQPEHFVNLHAPFAPSVSLQWTYRDGAVVNLPCAFLVEGDIILLRPGQEVPAKCRTLEYFPQLLGDNEIEELAAGDLFNPRCRETNNDAFTLPETREPLKPRPFIMLETPFTQNLKMMINEAHCRPVSVINNERYMVYSVWVERRILPTVLIISFLTNLVRYLCLQDQVGHWTDMLIVLQVEALIPLSALVLPFLWKVLDLYGTAKIMVVFEKFRSNSTDTEVEYKGDFGSEGSSHVPTDVTWSWKEIGGEMCRVMLGNTPALPRTCNIAHVLGNVTSFCCVDKKGVLSWPNPTAEKVFFLRNDIGSKDKQWSSTSGISEDDYSGSENIDSFDGEFKSVSNKNIREQDFLLETNFEVLDLTQDANNGYKLHFDDPAWKKYLTSLKPLGLNILLNTCNIQTVNKYTEFADHVTCASLKREEAAPVLNRRCFCELARQIGFSERALEIFKLHQLLGTYRHLPPHSSGKNLVPTTGSKSFNKYKMPMPNMFSVVVKEINTGMSQLMSQGTADILLDACSDYWDGHDLCTLTEVDRKKVTDFYQRTSMSSYCTAFSYRPLTQALGSEFKDLFIEIPEVHDQLYPQVHSPTPTKSWDTESLDSRLQSAKSKYHCSMDSLLINMDSNSIHDIDGAFRMQCNQVFIGMITMQYQAKQDVVELIEDLESACIRFVHFSKENELRSRVFSEKMGLEAGWNCHISLLGERVQEQDESTMANSTAPDGPLPPCKVTINRPLFASSGSLHRNKAKRSNDSLRFRRGSAPSAINLEITQVKFESGSPLSESPAQSPMTGSSSQRMQSHSEQELKKSSRSPHQQVQRRRDSDENSDKLTDPLLKISPDTDEAPAAIPAQDGENVSEVELELLDNKSTQLEQATEADENLSSSESYPASSSHFTENTDSVTGGFGLTNRAKLPKGIENIRPHIDNVDNVPLLVSLFTDCTPETSREMIAILQDYGEVVCCLGSSANIHNTGIYLQADCSLSVEPMYPHVCMCEPAVGNNWFESRLGPLELSTMLHSLPCALNFHIKDKISIMQLIAQARQHVQGVRHTFLLLLMLQLSLVVMQLLDSMLLPPVLAPHHVLWLAALGLPLLALTINANPLDPDIMKKALGKNIHHLSNQVVLEFLFYFCAGCIPTIFVCLLCHAANLHTFCHKVTSNDTCHILYGHSDFPEVGGWNGWTTEYYAGLALSQNIVAFQFLLYSGCATLCFIHRYHHLWERSPFNNRILCLVLPILLLLQLIYCVADIGIRNELGKNVFRLEDVPVVTWVLVVVWPIVLVAIQELIKRREIKLYVRYQKRARLDFGTKLGMNSPF